MKRNYEMMLLVNPQAASTTWDDLEKTLKAIFEKHGAEIQSFQKWGERRLAYQINKAGHKYYRGTYILVYFASNTDTLNPIKDDLRLNENVVRYMVLQLKKQIQQVAKPQDFETASLIPERGGPRNVE